MRCGAQPGALCEDVFPECDSKESGRIRTGSRQRRYSPGDRGEIADREVVRTVKTIMLTCGMYDGSGEFAVEVRENPSKSGVGGGILSVVDRKMGIGIYGPSLDKKGNSMSRKPCLNMCPRN